MATAFNLTARIQFEAAGLPQVTARVRQAMADLNKTGGAGTGQGFAAARFQAAEQQMRAAAAAGRNLSTALGEGSSAFERFGQQAGLAARRFVAFSLAAGGILKLVQSVKSGIG